MKRFIAILLLIAAWGLMHAFPAEINSRAIDQDVKTLNSLRISIGSVNRSSGTIRVELRGEEEFDLLLAHGFEAIRLPDLARQYAQKLGQIKGTGAPKDEYYTYAQYQQFMQDTAAQYPNICSLVSIGNSVQGRPILFMKITDNPTLEEAEPEFKYVSSIHGNEVVGYDMCIRLVQQLTTQYGTNARITNLVNDMEIWICPMMNPDGFALGQRFNANGIDLNRNFPMPTGELHPDGNATAIENTHMMNFCNDRNFVLSANFHGGALVANYPWDYTYVLAPDNELLIQAALAYSSHNPPMFDSDEFPQGITNGADWYVITGSMQDWIYGLTGGTDITMEIGEDMWPPASQLPTYWSQNQESMLSYLEFAQRGLRGLVTSESGSPLEAEITVRGNTKTVHTDPDAGDYYRLLMPGTYTVTASADGYIPKTLTVTVPGLGYSTQDFVLEFSQPTNFYGQARNTQGNGIQNLTVTLGTDPPTTTTADASGSFQFLGVMENQYQITISHPSLSTYSFDFLLTDEENRQVFVLTDPALPLNDACQSMDNWTYQTPWGTTMYQGESVITDSPSGNYGNNIYRQLRITNPISLQNIIEPELTIRTIYDLESGYDYVYVQASTTTSNWTDLDALTGTQSTWQTLSYSLDQFAGQSVYIRFVIDSDWSETGDGIYLDEIKVSGIDGSYIFLGDVDENRRISRADAKAIADYVIGLDPLPQLDPIPWDQGRIAIADLDWDQELDAFDSYLVLKYLCEPNWIFPHLTGIPENPGDPGLTASYDGQLNIGLAQPELLKSLTFTTSPVQIQQIFHQGYILGCPFVQSYNIETDSYAYAGYNVQHESLYATLEDDPQSFTLQYNLNGMSGSQFVNTSSAGEDPLQPPLTLSQNYPNPFNPTTSITFTLPREQHARLEIYNTRGQLVRVLADAVLPSGPQTLVWDGTDDKGNGVSSGVFLYKLESGNKTLIRRMMLIK